MTPPQIVGPARRPCGSCPYRRDVASGVWAKEEYDRLPGYDLETFDQPPGVFMCHQQDGHLCAGWVGCHDMQESFGLRIVTLNGMLSVEEYNATLDYECPVPLWGSGAEAAAHGLAELESPGPKARRTIEKLERKRGSHDD